MTPEELRRLIAQGRIRVVLDPVNDTEYWNIDWDVARLYQVIHSTNKQYHETHTYIEGVFDCNDMAIDIWNMLHKQGIASVIVVGNLDLDNESFAKSNHAWLLVTYAGIRLFAVEPTSGKTYTIYYDMDNDSKAFKQYLEGYYFASPSDLRAAVKERW